MAALAPSNKAGAWRQSELRLELTEIGQLHGLSGFLSANYQSAAKQRRPITQRILGCAGLVAAIVQFAGNRNWCSYRGCGWNYGSGMQKVDP